MPRIECQTCKGRGTVDVSDTMGHIEGGEYISEVTHWQAICSDCEGRGWAEEPKERETINRTV